MARSLVRAGEVRQEIFKSLDKELENLGCNPDEIDEILTSITSRYPVARRVAGTLYNGRMILEEAGKAEIYGYSPLVRIRVRDAIRWLGSSPYLPLSFKGLRKKIPSLWSFKNIVDLSKLNRYSRYYHTDQWSSPSYLDEHSWIEDDEFILVQLKSEVPGLMDALYHVGDPGLNFYLSELKKDITPASLEKTCKARHIMLARWDQASDLFREAEESIPSWSGGQLPWKTAVVYDYKKSCYKLYSVIGRIELREINKRELRFRKGTLLVFVDEEENND